MKEASLKGCGLGGGLTFSFAERAAGAGRLWISCRFLFKFNLPLVD